MLDSENTEFENSVLTVDSVEKHCSTISYAANTLYTELETNYQKIDAIMRGGHKLKHAKVLFEIAEPQISGYDLRSMYAALTKYFDNIQEVKKQLEI